MQNDSEFTLLQMKEGNILRYLDVLESMFNGVVKDNTFTLNEADTQIRVSFYSIIPEFEFLVNQATFNKAIVIDRTPDGLPDYYHINIVKEGKVIQDYNNEQQFMDAGSSKGIFIYNGLFPLKSNFPANQPLRTISFKLSKSALIHFMPEAVEIFDALFENDEPKGYHTHITTEMDRVITDILHYELSDFGRTMMVSSKAMELFTLLMKSVQLLLKKDELHGLHINDYNRLMLIKKKIIQSIETKINIEQLADEFAVSVSKLQRDFKALFDCSVYQLYTHAKMDEAYRRLKTGDYTVMEVGYDLGYNSLSKFSQMFKKTKGVNPKDVIPQ